MRKRILKRLRFRKTKFTKQSLRRNTVTAAVFARIFAVHVYRHAERFARFTHHHIAKRPHQHLIYRWEWYGRWHDHPKHQHIHYSVLALYLIVVGSAVMVSYQKVHALSDLSDTWNFSTAASYNIDDGIETFGSIARLKAQNYTADANTKALYHFDESSGAVAADSSSNVNDGTISNGTFAVGQLNNGLQLNGTTAFMSVPDSPSLSISQQNTLESWTKLNSPLSGGTLSQRQGIMDKGDYQLYYDNETGKVTYELADATATQWSQAGGNDVSGGWDLNGKRSVNATVKVGSDVYVGIGVDVGDAEVWKWDGSIWSKIGGGPESVNSSWAAQTFEGVYSLSTDGTNLFAGLGSSAGDAEVWKWDGSIWSKIGGDAINSSWQVSTFEYVWSLDYFGGKLYAGLGASANDAEVWEWNGSAWTKIGGDSLNSGWTTSFETVTALTNDGTTLYAGLGTTVTDAEVWSWNGSAWTKIGGDGVNSSWNTSYEAVRSLRYLGGKLYAGLGDSTTDAEVWVWNGSTWSQIGGDGVNSSWDTDYEQIGAFAWDGINLYAGLGTGNGDGEVWKWNGSSWSQMGGDGINNSWASASADTVNTLYFDSGKLYAGTYDSAGSGWVYTYDGTNWALIGGNNVNNSWGYYGTTSVQVMQNVGDKLYAGLGGTAGAATIWQYDGSTWQLIGGQGVNNSWGPNVYEQVMSMSNYGGHLVVGLGTSSNDAEVWEWDGSSWSQIGGDSLNSGWTTNYEEVDSLASDGTYLYAGIGASASDGEIWRWNGSSWTKIGGDSINSGWTTGYDRVSSLSFYRGKLLAGLGSSSGEAEVWEWSGSSWTKVGGDSVASSWPTPGYEQVESMIPYNGKLYVGLGNSTDDAEVWEWDGSSWSQIGGDDLNSSWTSGTYERVKTLAVYNGDLYAGLGSSTGDGEAWKWDGSSWAKAGGNGVNNSWGGTIEEVESFSAYKGKLYAGLGLSANVDGQVWSLGNNAFLTSNASSFDTNWHHIAATYDGTTMKIFIDGTLDASKSVSVSLPDSSRPLLIGTTYGGREYGKPRGNFDGKLDETRISDIARSSFASKPYSSTDQTITLADAVRKSGVWHWDNFTPDETLNGGAIYYRLSDDDGATWKYWDGSAWSTSASTSFANPASTIDANIVTFPVTFNGLKWQAILRSDGNQRVTLNSVTILSTADNNAPATNASSIVASKANGGSALSSNGWTNGSSPYFSWTAGNDTEAGIKGYCVYLGTDNTADPATSKGLLGSSPIATANHCQYIVSGTDFDTASGYLATALTTSNTPYYLTIKAIDNAGNISSSSAQFHFRFDNTPPTNPGFITAPSGFINNKDVTLTWPTTGGSTPADANSGLAGLQYKIGGSNWYGDSHSGTGDITDLLSNDGSYTTQPTPDYANLSDGINNVSFRTWDQAGNVTTTYATAAIKLNTSGAPSEPQNLTASPTTNTSNSFSFSWQAPDTYVGDANNLSYCYTINTLPSDSTCTFTNDGATSLGSGPYATQPGTNTLYLVAKDESSNINYSSYSLVNFSANTQSPGLPLNTDIVDVSIKSSSNWRLALTWETPTDVGAGVSAYKVYRSTDNTSFSFVGSSSSTTYIDAGLSQERYYYRIRACDSTNNCGANSSTVDQLPTGKFTSPASIVADPEVSGVTTKKAKITWSTDRASDSKVAIGTTSGHYGTSEVSNSAQKSLHVIDLDNLSAGTTYYYVAKWTDEDGNTGASQEYSFTTAPAPTLKEISAKNISLTSATLQFTSRDATKVAVYYGKSESFGGLKTVNTSLSESSYSVELTGLDDGSKYFYRLVSYDSEDNSYNSSIASFTTPQRPRIANLRFQPVDGEPTSTQSITWDTNVPSSSSIIYSRVGGIAQEEQNSELTTSHTVIIRGLEDNSEYTLIAHSRDADGNLATSDEQAFRTALDTRPPKLSNIVAESSVRGVGAEARGQVVLSWHTDEPSTSQVAYAEGSGATVFNTKTAEDTGLSTEHVVIVSDLPTSKVYSLQPISRDRSGNQGNGKVQSAIIGRASDSVLTIVLNTLKKVFGI